MNYDILLLTLTIVCALTVGAYVYKKEFDTPPPPKPDIRYYHINFQMPLYEYQCEICSNIDESIEKIHTEEIECSLCNSKSKRIISLSNFELKGSGWYKDGYSSSPSKNTEKQTS